MTHRERQATLSTSAAEAALPVVLALDIGTTSVRAQLVDRRGRMVEESIARRGYAIETSQDGGAWVDAPFLLELVAACIDEALAAVPGLRDPIAGVGISCFWHSLLGVDAAGRPTTPVLTWADSRSAEETSVLRASHDEAAFRDRTGVRFHSSYWPAKLRWLQRTDPAAVARTTRWTSFGDFLAMRWQGVDQMSLSNASSTGMLGLVSGDWDPATLRVAGIDRETLPPLVDRWDGVTGLVGSLGERWPALQSVPWYPSIGDGACANVGCGATTPDRIAMTLGTSGALRVVSRSAVGDPLLPPPNLWIYRLDRERIVTGAAISNGGVVAGWLAAVLEGGAPDLLDAAGEIAPDGHGLTMLPFLAGERAPIWNDFARGVIAGLSLDTTPAEIMRAGLESVALRLALIYRDIRPTVPARHLIAANGAALLRSALWQQVCADALGHAVASLPEDLEASARGAALLALEACGAISDIAAVDDPVADAPVVEPDAATHSTYLAAGARQERLRGMLYPDGEAWDHRLAPAAAGEELNG